MLSKAKRKQTKVEEIGGKRCKLDVEFVGEWREKM